MSFRTTVAFPCNNNLFSKNTYLLTCLRVINVRDSRSIENNNKHAENDTEEEGGGQLEDGLAVEPEHVQELRVDEESVA